jgi:transcriptional regulator with XRE-family HTH domain
MTNSGDAERVKDEPRADAAVREIGAQIRLLRNRAKMTLSDVSAVTGISVSMLSMLERGAAGPSIGTLVAVASALGAHMADLFEGTSTVASPTVRRAADQLEVKTQEGVVRRVAHNDKAAGIEVVVNEYQPRTMSADAPMRHSGVEFGVVLDGAIEVEIDGETHVVGAGDAISYSSRRPHLIRNVDDRVARTVWVNVDA